jgi:D-3-phosphoglycerate dehydrogenase
MLKLNILFLSEVSSPSFIKKIKKDFNLIRIQDLKVDDFSNIDIIWTHLNHKIDKLFVSQFPSLRYIVSPVTGINHLDIEYISHMKIKLITLRGEKYFLRKVTATAEHTWAIFLTLQKNVLKAHNSLTCEYNFNRNDFDSNQLYNKSVGIIGYGRIGKIIAKYAATFNMKVHITDIKKVNYPRFVSFVSLEELLSKSDYVFLTSSYTLDYHHFINIDKFKLMKPTSIFINTSRGELVNETDLIFVLNNKLILGAAIDVFDDELNFDCYTNKLVEFAQKNSNLILTPHIGGRSSDALDLVEIHLLEKLKKLIN